MAPTAPHPETVEAWARAYVESTDLGYKLAPPAPPKAFSGQAEPIRIAAPGRPAELDLISRTRRSVPRSKIANPKARAQLLHTFWHHELQAAELMAFAILAFPGTPAAFRRGLLAISMDEIRHMRMYADHITTLGHRLGDFPVRDWFWQRVQTCTTPMQFVALMGIGLEGGNLDHTRRFETWFREAGDDSGAALIRQVGDEEIAHVRFAMRWFREWSNGVDFDAWRAQLVEPLTPTMMKGDELDDSRRRRAGYPPEFLAALRQW